jgi:hypothetical protein
VDQRFLGSRMGRISEDVLGNIWDALDRLTGRGAD